jgi:hypothetical protein
MSRLKGVFAVSLAAALLSACGGGGSSNVAPVPQAPQSTQPGKTVQKWHVTALPKTALRHFATLKNNKKELMYSRSYLRAHPELAWGPNAKRRPMQGGNDLNYNGGPVQTNPSIDVIYWGWQGPSDPTNDPNDAYDYFNGFLSAIGGGGWINTDTQYYDTLNGTEYIGNPSGQLANVLYDSSTPPNPYQDSDIQNEALAAENYLGDYSVSTNYIVVTPTGYSTSGFGTQWCAYHSTTTDGSGNTVSYTEMPYVDDAGGSCGQGSVNSPGTNDGFSIVGGHEEAETQTDPQLNAWIDSSGEEIGDKCAWQNLQNNPNAGNYPTQPLYDNAISGCAQSGP